ncbi:ThiF family adenylyltransferase [Mesorhizobium sp. ASY16-5R]|uniref:ThiF family adenylyltransferase n=1 Tax=Mesorhizobium sp. ASY16-5R TaxID=3445772 RepID=UPI003F9EC426
MTTYSLTMREDHADLLRAHLLRGDGNEHAAYVLCSRAAIRRDPWDREAHERYHSVRVIPVPDDQVLASSPGLITWSTASYVRALREAAAQGYVVAVVHNHPEAMTWFSSQDDSNEPDLVQLAVNRNGDGTKMLSLLLTADGQWAGRVWLLPRAGAHAPLRIVRILGRRFGLHYEGRGGTASLPAFHRQALAFGRALNDDLARLRVGVVGCGGTGSAVAMLLARLGVGQIVVIDNDIVDRTNLNRLHGARQQDADAMRPKVDVVAESIAAMGLGVKVVAIEAWVGDPECRDALRSCDVIFGCTDDHEGRLFLNRLAYYYLVPVIDVGLAIDVDRGAPPVLRALDGRVSVLTPRETCLICRDIVSAEAARGEAMKRADPEAYEQRKAEAYVVGERNPAPAVVTFTTELACMAVNEMIQRLQGFRDPDGSTAHRVRKFHLGEDRRPRHDPRPACPICATEDVWGCGDVEPFLGRVA